MRIRYNAPVTLTFSLLCAAILLLDQITGNNIVVPLFTAPGRGSFPQIGFLGLFRLLSHVFGHASWSHLVANMSLILLLGPILEEKYGSRKLLVMMVTTALVTGLLNALLFTTGLLGASGIVFMMVLLVSFTNIREGEVPLTFILVFLLFLSREIMNSFAQNTISEMTHIMGGIIGSLYGFLSAGKR